MTVVQKLTIRLSEIRSKLNELSGLETPSKEEVSQMETLGKEYQDKEIQFRSAVIVEGEKQAGKEFLDDGEGAEIRSIKNKCSIVSYVNAAAKGSGLNGPEAELNDSLEVRNGGGIHVPWTMLYSDRGIERRAEGDAGTVSDTGTQDGGTAQRPILQRLFGKSVFEALGVRIDSVPTGKSEWPIITAGVAPAMTAELAQNDAVEPTMGTVSLKPKRLTGRYIFTAEQAAQVSGIEAALRRDLADAVMAKMSNQIINGDGTGVNVAGFLSEITGPSAPGAASSWEKYASAAAQAVDGIHAYNEKECSVVLGDDTYRKAASVRASGSADFATDSLARKSLMILACSFMPAPASSVQDALVHARGPEMGEMRGDSVASVWPTLELIRDIYTRAGEGETVLTWIALWDAKAAHRAGAYKRLKFNIS